MAEQTPNPLPEQQGIFEPKPLSADQIPRSGKEKALRLGIVLLAGLTALIVWLCLRNPFMRPVQQYYRALSARDAAEMTGAFPAWLVNSEKKDDAMSIGEMCAAIVSATNMQVGSQATVKAELVSVQEVEQAYLDRLSDGISSQYHTDVSITRGAWIKLLVSYDSSGTVSERSEYARVYKINGKWCLLDVPGTTQ